MAEAASSWKSSTPPIRAGYDTFVGPISVTIRPNDASAVQESKFMRSPLLAAAAAAALCPWLPLVSAAQTSAPPSAHYGAWGVDLTTGDRSVSPGDDFFAYAEGGWYARAVIPADQSYAGAQRDVVDRTQAQLRILIETAAKDPKTPTAAQIGAVYTAWMDEARLEQVDDTPLKVDLARIAAAPDKAAFSKLMAATYGGFGKSVFGLSVGPDPRHPEVNALYLDQDGLGLPDRDYYLTDGFKPQREAYLAYVTRTFGLMGHADPAGAAAAVLALETRIAKASWTQVDERDIDKTINPMTVADLQAYAPGLDWSAHLTAAGAPGQAQVIVGPKGAIQALAAIFADTPLETLKAWESFHVADSAAPYLSKRFDDSQFAFRKTLTGVDVQLPRWKRGVGLIDGSLGEAVGREYVAAYFPPEAKAKMRELVANLKAAMAARIQGAAWMAPATQAEALKKLAKMDVQVGYPDKWRDYSALKIDAADLYGDIQRSQAFEWAYQLSDLGKAVDHQKWGMTPQTVDAYNGGLENKIVFPAGILQPPYFDASADSAVNYGSAGATIGHEITHGFDDQGRKIDDTGAVRDWWTGDDARRFETQAAKFGAQYDTYEPVPGAYVNGKLTMGENIADLGGLLAALDAYHASLHGQAAPVIDGLTGDQRFFLAYAQSWRIKVRDDAARRRLVSDPHSPARFRVIGPTRNDDAWYAAFAVKPGQKYYLAPSDRARIW
jgi:putative endopeptidase